MAEQPEVERRGLDRLVFFSDATVAIAITLLVLPLIDLANDHPADESPLTLIWDNWSAFVAFFITFAVLSRFWLLHHRLFQRVIAYDRSVVRASFMWLLSVVFLPFCADLVSRTDSSHARAAYGLYVGTTLVTTLSFAALEHILRGHPDLVEGPMPDEVSAVIAIVILAVCLALVLLFPQVGMLWLLLLVASGPLNALVRRERRR
jgi:uncharacterized membrane protein